MGDFGNAYDELDQMDVHQAVTEVLTSVLGENVFSLRKVDAWSENICEGVLKKLSGMKKNYKYVVTTTLTQKCGAGIHIARASIMDQEKDMIIKVDYDSNPTISGMVAVYCVAI